MFSQVQTLSKPSSRAPGAEGMRSMHARRGLRAGSGWGAVASTNANESYWLMGSADDWLGSAVPSNTSDR